MEANQVNVTTHKAKTIALTVSQLDGLRNAFASGIEKLKSTVKTASSVGAQVGINLVNGEPLNTGIDNVIYGDNAPKHLASNNNVITSPDVVSDAFDVEKNVIPEMPSAEPTNAEIIESNVVAEAPIVDTPVIENNAFYPAEEIVQEKPATDLSLSTLLDSHFEYEELLESKDFELSTIRNNIDKVMRDIEVQEICLEYSDDDKKGQIAAYLKDLNEQLTKLRNEYMIVSAVSQEMSDRYIDNAQKINEFVNSNSLSALEFLATTVNNSNPAETAETKQEPEEKVESVYVAYPSVGTKSM